jgi:hypothetical protein
VALAAAVACAAAGAQAQSSVAADAVAACAEKGAGGAATYVDESIAQLKAAVPELKNLKTDAKSEANACATILSHKGTMLGDMLPRIPNLIAREQVTQMLVPLPLTVNEGRSSHEVEGVDLDIALHERVVVQGKRSVYNYRIRSAENGGNSAVAMLSEFRTDEKNEAVDAEAAGGPHWQGFAGAWMMFVPDHWSESRFRYLGEEKINGHDTFVLAFAQIPERVSTPGAIENAGGGSSQFFLQGLAWIDRNGYEIVRLHTDLLAPLHGDYVHLRELRSGIVFLPVTIAERNLTLWLPSKVEVLWEMHNQAGAEIHVYSKYRLFTVTSKIIAPQ